MNLRVGEPKHGKTPPGKSRKQAEEHMKIDYEPGVEQRSRRLGIRWWICSLLFLASTINYMDRALVGVLKPTLQKELGWNEIDFSNVIFWFQVAYAAGYLFAGRLIDLIGVRIGYALAVIFWSAAAMAHAAARTVFGFSVARFGLGLAEGGNFPAAIKSVSEWFPRKERALATGLLNAGSSVGAILTPLLVPWIALWWGWRAAFLLIGALGFAWTIAWLWLYRSPEKHPRLSVDELAYIRSDGPESTERISWGGSLKYRGTWAFIVGMCLTSPIWWFYLYWVPDFLFKQYGLDLTTMGLPLVVIYLMSDFGSVGGGWLSSRLIRRGWSLNAGRKIAMLVCALCVLPVFFAAKASGLWTAVFLIGLATAAHQGWAANLYTLVSDTIPRRAVSSVVGIGGTVGSVAGMFFAKFVGYVLEATHNYRLLFGMASCAYLLALVIIQTILPRIIQIERANAD
jgi:MFS transporter, ACS family, hexuronate transporter